MKHILKLLFLLVFAGSAFAQLQVPGMLDRTFGRRGVVSERPPSPYVAYVNREVLTQPDGKIIAVGDRFEAGVPQGGYSWLMIRYNRNGSRDLTFGNDGIVTSSFGTSRRAHGAALQRDGKLIVCGGVTTTDGGGFAMARYMPDGNLDLSFGQGGLVITDTSTPAVTSLAYAEKVIVLPDGRIMLITPAASFRNDPYESLPASMIIARYLPDGSLDQSYGAGGISIIPMDLQISFLLSAVDAFDGHLIITTTEETYRNFYLKQAVWIFKLNGNGSLDRGFGQSGRVPSPSDTLYRVLKVFTNGDLLMVDDFHRRMFIVRSNGQTGPVVVSGDPIAIDGYRFFPGKPLVRPDGKFISVGWAESLWAPTQRALVRFNQDGTIDPSYGRGGLSLGPTYAQDEIFHLQPDGGVINAANLGDTALGFNLVKYSGDPQIDPTD